MCSQGDKLISKKKIIIKIKKWMGIKIDARRICFPTKLKTHSFKVIKPSHHFTLFFHVQNEAPVEFKTTGSHGGIWQRWWWWSDDQVFWWSMKLWNYVDHLGNYTIFGINATIVKRWFDFDLAFYYGTSLIFINFGL